MDALTEEQLEEYRAYSRAREKELREQIKTRLERGWELAGQAAVILKEEFGASRVVVFGSLLHPPLFHLRSDIDLAVWDIQHYFRAVARLLDLDPDFDFDLVPFEDARPSLAAVIEKEGREL